MRRFGSALLCAAAVAAALTFSAATRAEDAPACETPAGVIEKVSGPPNYDRHKVLTGAQATTAASVLGSPDAYEGGMLIWLKDGRVLLLVFKDGCLAAFAPLPPDAAQAIESI